MEAAQFMTGFCCTPCHSHVVYVGDADVDLSEVLSKVENTGGWVFICLRGFGTGRQPVNKIMDAFIQRTNCRVFLRTMSVEWSSFIERYTESDNSLVATQEMWDAKMFLSSRAYFCPVGMHDPLLRNVCSLAMCARARCGDVPWELVNDIFFAIYRLSVCIPMKQDLMDRGGPHPMPCSCLNFMMFNHYSAPRAP